MLALLVLHRAKLLASNQSILALGVAPRRVAGTPVPVFPPPARMPGVYAKRLCTMQSQPSIHCLSPRGRGLGIGIENLLYFYKYRLFLQTKTTVAGMQRWFCISWLFQEALDYFLFGFFSCKTQRAEL